METIRRFLKALRLRMDCWEYDHKWDSTRGYYDEPNHGATCKHCGLRVK